ncbi:HSPB1-associated protein 1 isoform X2 [Phymastichus coffea]|uniref:HSPB1-associated protein 1 isoform X2 n=1 Tax=Phymastichus coffea TaxID=108790 RepID=UPI00273B0D03|nr:HSPB1-associated protein 1 isoform X2 [Phymastichus coffea]
METLQRPSSDNLKESFTEVLEPILFKNILCTTEGSNCWKLLDWSLNNFAAKCGNSKLPFRVGRNTYTIEPQWEVNTEIEHKTMEEFLRDTTRNCDSSKWFYFDYKYMNKWFNDKPEILESFNWQQFGLDLGSSDSTIWVGSKGAHTNCHQDTYGCNLVAQTHGRKLWLLFSPKCTSFMQPTRIPYEESTIYKPRDVLFIPKGWWHYVESLDTSLSVNIWLPLKEDCISRLKETLVHLVINTIGDGVSRTEDQSESSLLECVELLENSIKECKIASLVQEPSIKKKKINVDITNVLQSLKMKYSSYMKSLPDLTSKNISDFTSKNNIVASNISKNNQHVTESNQPSKLELIEAVVDAFCNPEIVENVSKILMHKFL